MGEKFQSSDRTGCGASGEVARSNENELCIQHCLGLKAKRMQIIWVWFETSHWYIKSQCSCWYTMWIYRVSRYDDLLIRCDCHDFVHVHTLLCCWIDSLLNESWTWIRYVHSFNTFFSLLSVENKLYMWTIPAAIYWIQKLKTLLILCFGNVDADAGRVAFNQKKEFWICIFFFLLFSVKLPSNFTFHHVSQCV